MQFLFFYTPQPRSQVWIFINGNYWRCPSSNQPIHRPPIFSLEIVQCPYKNRNRGRLLRATARLGVFKGRFILDYEQKMHTSSRVMETNPPGANRPLTDEIIEDSPADKTWLKFNFKINPPAFKIP